MSSNASTNREFAEWLANAFKEVDWPIPPYLQLGFLSPLAKAVKDAPSDAKLKIMGEGLGNAYSMTYLATMFLDRYSKIPHVRDFARQIKRLANVSQQSFEPFLAGARVHPATRKALEEAVEMLERDNPRPRRP